MSRRPGILTTVRRPTEAGVSPNAFVGELTAEVRLHWTPYSTWDEIAAALRLSHQQALYEAKLVYEEEGHPWPVGIGGRPGGDS